MIKISPFARNDKLQLRLIMNRSII